MQYRLIEVKVAGIKSIKDEIEISFSKKNFNDTIFNDSLVKAIYGPNGSGKTGFISSFKIYQTLVTTEFPFKAESYNSLLLNLINKKSKRFTFDVTFAVKDKDIVNRINHRIEIASNEFGQFYIAHEVIHLLNSRLAVGKLVFESIAGNESFNSGFGVDPLILRNNSIVCINRSQSDKPMNKIVGYVLGFAQNLCIVYGEKQDSHSSHFLEWIYSNSKEEKMESNEYIVNQIKETIISMPGTRCFDIIPKNELNTYKKGIEKMESFIKLLKQDLKRIDIKKKTHGEGYIINLDFVYKDYSVDYEYESTGVKKLCTLFSAFLAARNGRITLIDEIDSNIHDTFLTKLFDYFITYSDAQIVCTTHNVELMSVISSRSKTIDFLSDDNKVIPWIKTGRFSPAVLYLKGRIQFIPFNLDSSEFAEVFSDE